MPTITRTATIDHPPAEVWDLWSDVRILPRLSDSTEEVVEAPDRLRAVGDSFVQRLRVGGRRMTVRWEVTEIDPGRRLVVTADAGFGVHPVITEVVAPSGTGTEATLCIDYTLPFGPVGRLVSRLGLERIARAESAELLERLAALIDAPTEAPSSAS